MEWVQGNKGALGPEKDKNASTAQMCCRYRKNCTDAT